jgi:hypothetical protein
MAVLEKDWVELLRTSIGAIITAWFSQTIRAMKETMDFIINLRMQ